MTEGNTSSSEPDAPTDHHVENSSNSGADHSAADSDDAIDTSAMVRALKHELEDKGMTVEIEDDGETLSAEKLGRSYRIHPDGTVEGNGVLKDGIKDIIDDLDPVQDTEAEKPEIDAEPAFRANFDDDSSSTDENEKPEKSEESEESSESVNNEDETATPPSDGVPPSESDTPKTPAGTESTAESVEDDGAAEEEEKEGKDEAQSLPEGPVGRFEAAIEIGHLQQAIDAAHAVVDECRVHLDTDGLVIRAVDPANVAMVDEQVSADAFEAYETDCGVIGINLDRLDKVVGIADNDDDLVQFDIDAATRKLGVQVSAVEYTLALIDPDAIRAEPEIPDLEWPAHFAVEQADFKRAIRAADMVSNHIRLRVDADERCFVAEAEGDTDNVELEVSAEDLEEATLRDADSLFSLDYLKDLRKPIPKDTPVHVQLGEEFPIILRFEMANGSVDVEYVLAPRLQNR